MSKVRDHFGISQYELGVMLEEQNYCCAICGKKFENDINVDHCHLYNEVRQCLCLNCNLMLGHAKDDVGILKRGIDYLNYWREIHEEHLKNSEF